MKKYLITSALPYANGPLHFGHLSGAYLPADIYARHRRNQGGDVVYISGSDEHGVAIMLNAKKAGIDYKKYVDGWHQEHKEIFKAYGVEFDFFGQTSAEYHEEEVVKWFHELNAKGLIETKINPQLYCNDCHNHLPDRFVEGTCYKCGYEQARGDECPNCGELIESTQLKNPVCKICESRNISEEQVTQYYLMLSKFHKEYREWFSTKKDLWRKTVYPYVNSLTEESLHDRAITRDLDWGIDVPLAEAKGKKLYVWFDAPIGYVSNTKQFFKESGRSEDYLLDWWQNKDVELSHFIGKDNIIFHTIIFPVMSMASGQAKPADEVPANQYVNLEGKQFSKSTGWYVDAKKALDDFGQNALRYYLISLIPENSDSSFTWDQLQVKVNNELANNIGNFMNRCFKFFQKNWAEGMDAELFDGFAKSSYGEKLTVDLKAFNESVDGFHIKKGLEQIMAMGFDANNYFSDQAPWAQIKADKNEAAKTIAFSTQYALVLGVLFSSYLPDLSQSILKYFDAVVSSEQKSALYQGDLSVLKDIFAKGFNVEGSVDALVPKIDDKVIKALNEDLKTI